MNKFIKDLPYSMTITKDRNLVNVIEFLESQNYIKRGDAIKNCDVNVLSLYQDTEYFLRRNPNEYLNSLVTKTATEFLKEHTDVLDSKLGNMYATVKRILLGDSNA